MSTKGNESKTIEQIKVLLKSKGLAEKIQAAQTTEAIKLLVGAGAEKGYHLTIEGTAKALEELNPVVPCFQISEADLNAVSAKLAAHPTWGSKCGNSTFGHTCCWHCY